MTETPDTPTTPTTEPATVAAKPYWLYRFAAWVGIVAGIVFIVLSIFFAGFKAAHLGHHKCHHPGGRHHPMMQEGPKHHDEGTGFRHGFGGPGPSQMPPSVTPSLTPAQP